MSIVGLGKEEMKMKFKRICAVALCALILILSSSAAYAQYGGADHEPNAVRSGMAVKSGVVVEVLASQVAEEASTLSRVTGSAIGCLPPARATSHWDSYGARAGALTACGAIAERVVNSVASGTVAVQTFIARIDDGGQQVAAVQKDPDIRKVDRVYLTWGRACEFSRLESESWRSRCSNTPND
jgi:hypothetical protein